MPDRSIGLFTIISPIGLEGGNGIINPFKQVCKLAVVTAVLIGQNFRAYFTCTSMDHNMQLAPFPSRFDAMIVLRTLTRSINLGSYTIGACRKVFELVIA